MGAANALQALVSRLRRVLAGVHVASHPAGYSLVIDPDAVDVARFERLVAMGRAALTTDTLSAARILREALDLWRGPALLDVAGAEFFRAPVIRLSELRMAALEDRIGADLRLGRGRELTSELSTMVAEHPWRERMIVAVQGGPDLSRPYAARVEAATRAALGEEFVEATRDGAGVSIESVRELAAITFGD